MYELLFLSILGLVWIIFATFQDLKTKEIANWLNFSLIFFALGFRFFYSLFSAGNFNFFYQGLMGLAIFFILGNLFYYGRLFAGGDGKLFISLGAIIPLSYTFLITLEILFSFIVIFLFAGAFYSIFFSIFLGIKNHKKIKKEIGKQFTKNKKIFYFAIPVSIILLIFGYFEQLFIFIAILVFLLPYLYIYAKAVDEVAMVRKIKSSKLREGDWLYADVKIGKRIIKADWGGLEKKEISFLRKHIKIIKIREGIAFTPVFLISFLIFLYFLNSGLWNSFW